MHDDLIKIDKTEPAYTVFMRVSDADPATSTQIQFVPMIQLQVHPNAYFDHADPAIIETIMSVLESSVGMPIGLTWQGQIAVTYNDYRYAEQTYTTNRGVDDRR